MEVGYNKKCQKIIIKFILYLKKKINFMNNKYKIYTLLKKNKLFKV
jgi:hypothetical protein